MLVGVWLLYLAFGLNIAGLAPLVSVIEHDLAMSHSAMGQVLGVWQLVYIAASIPWVCYWIGWESLVNVGGRTPDCHIGILARRCG
ncbi:MAG: hypothetical protein CM1200mP20_14900 [Pseudomonadota bacterium]|nr:MAG: hypothetical protein CM1200mP20_14900 [Pseudomonadota bacterium]